MFPAYFGSAKWKTVVKLYLIIISCIGEEYVGPRCIVQYSVKKWPIILGLPVCVKLPSQEAVQFEV